MGNGPRIVEREIEDSEFRNRLMMNGGDNQTVSNLINVIAALLGYDSLTIRVKKQRGSNLKKMTFEAYKSGV